MKLNGACAVPTEPVEWCGGANIMVLLEGNESTGEVTTAESDAVVDAAEREDSGWRRFSDIFIRQRMHT